jgi:signal transduction histidine kinase
MDAARFLRHAHVGYRLGEPGLLSAQDSFMVRSIRAPLCLAWLLAAAFLSSPRTARQAPPAPLMAIRDVRAFLQTRRHDERRIDVRGIVTYFDADAKVIYMQDATGALAFEVGDLASPVAVGESVRLSGSLEPDSTVPRVLHPEFSILGRSRRGELMPGPKLVSAAALTSKEAEAEWVELAAVVRSVTKEGRVLFLELQAGGRVIHAAVLGQWNDPSLVDARVRLQGVSAARGHAQPQRRPAELLVPRQRYLQVEEDSPRDPFGLPLVSLDSLSKLPPAQLPERRVHVRGRVTRTEGHSGFVLTADGVEYAVATPDSTPLRGGDELDVVAFAVAKGGRLSLEQALVRSGPDGNRREPAPALPVLTRADRLRNLSASDAKKGYPIQLLGVVTCCDPGLVFVHDGTASVYVESWRHAHRIQPGDRVEVTGVSAPGDFAPIVNRPRVRVLGRGPLPTARRVRPEDLATGHEDGQWIEIDGVVRSVTPMGRVLVLQMAAGAFRFPVELPRTDAGDLARFVDAQVRVQGVCRSLLTPKGQLAGIVVNSPSLESLSVVTPAPSVPFALPATPINALLQFVPGQNWEHRVRVKGTITYRGLDESYIQDETGGLSIHGDGLPPPAIGEEVEAIGFATPGQYTPVLLDADVRTVGKGVGPAPAEVSGEQALSGRFDGELVQIEARLLDVVHGRDERQLSLQGGPYLFTAVLAGKEPLPEGLRAGSGLRVTGVCATDTVPLGVPRSFRILLRTASDIEVLVPASWWTPGRTIASLLMMVGVAGLALAWGATLRRRVRAQSSIIWKRVKRETELQERQRMARELHDTLEQNLAGISLSLEAASLMLPGDPKGAGQHVSRALEHVDTSIQEVHRAVWALREESLDTRGLGASLENIGRQLASSRPTPIRIDTSVEGSPRPFPLAVENNLLRIGQEALTNAVKHGRASRVQMQLLYQPHAFRLRVTDDGRGFDADAPPAPGHFGLIGMRERAAEIGARLDVRSGPDRGTEVQVTMALESRELRQAG